MARPTPQSFEKRQREIRKRNKRAEKLERRLDRAYEKKLAKEEEEHGGHDRPAVDGDEPIDGTGPPTDADDSPASGS